MLCDGKNNMCMRENERSKRRITTTNELKCVGKTAVNIPKINSEKKAILRLFLYVKCSTVHSFVARFC